jgi:uncharacterized phage-associated protein
VNISKATEEDARLTADRVASMILASTGWMVEKRLQCLLFMAQGWHQAILAQPFFDDEFEVQDGCASIPAVRAARAHRASRLPSAQQIPKMCDESCAVLGRVLGIYDSLSTAELEALVSAALLWISRTSGASKENPVNGPGKTCAESIGDYYIHTYGRFLHTYVRLVGRTVSDIAVNVGEKTRDGEKN